VAQEEEVWEQLLKIFSLQKPFVVKKSQQTYQFVSYYIKIS
jgi:hypothetical protein